jgi:putative ABC transport system substrate-binding protein
MIVRRRNFITLLGGAAAWPLAASAQQNAMPVVGYLGPESPETTGPLNLAAFREGLSEIGYVEGQNVTIEFRWAKGQSDQFPALAADLVRRRVNVITAIGPPALVLAAKAATTTIPIVFGMGPDAVELGLVTSLNRPGGNITGFSNIAPGLGAKRLELLHKLVPNAATIAILSDPTATTAQAQARDLLAAARILGLHLIFLNVSSERDFEAAFASVVEQRAGALLLVDSQLFNNRREQLVTLAARFAVPTIYTFRNFAAAGGLISYAANITEGFSQTGVYVGRILKGEKPGDLPVQLPTKFELVINLKTAKALGLTVPDTLLALADEVIE